MERDLIRVEYIGMVKLKNQNIEWLNGQALPLLYVTSEYCYVGRLGYVEQYPLEDCEIVWNKREAVVS